MATTSTGNPRARRRGRLGRLAGAGGALIVLGIPALSFVGAEAAHAASPDLQYATASSGYPSGCATQAYSFYQQSNEDIRMDVRVQDSNWVGTACRQQAELFVDTAMGSFPAATLNAPTACPAVFGGCPTSVDSGWQTLAPTAAFQSDMIILQFDAAIKGVPVSSLITGTHLVIAPRNQ